MLQVEMGRAQFTTLFENLKTVNNNIKQEYNLIESEKDAAKKKDFYSKVKMLQTKIPLMMQLSKKLDLDKNEGDKDLIQIKKELVAIKDKD